MHNRQIAAAFDEIADLLELIAANPFHVRAYRSAAERLRDWPEELADSHPQGHGFDEIPDIVEDLAGKILDLVERANDGEAAGPDQMTLALCHLQVLPISLRAELV